MKKPIITSFILILVAASIAVAPACAGEGQGPGAAPSGAVPPDGALAPGADPAAALNKPKPNPKAMRLDKEKKTIEIDGKICLDEGALELFACMEGGKEYETVIALQGEAWQLHLSLLLLGLKPGGGPQYQGDPSQPFGDTVIIEVQWEDNGKTIRKRAEDLMWDTKKDKTMDYVEWVFTGSRFLKDENGNDYYAANRDKSVVCVYHDPLTVIDNPLSTGGDQTTYIVNKKLVPPKGTPIVMIIKPGTKRIEAPPGSDKKNDGPAPGAYHGAPSKPADTPPPPPPQEKK